jgi:RNA polymerase sigma factor (sigma-70 family)
MAEPKSDTELIISIIRGHADGLAAAYEHHGASVYQMASRLCGPCHAEEVTQEVFLALWRKPEEFHSDECSLRSCLLAETHGRAVARLRDDTARRTRRARMSADALEQEVLGPWLSEAVRTLLWGLPDAERKAIVLAYFGGYTCKQVAALMRQSEEIVKANIGTGLSSLRASSMCRRTSNAERIDSSGDAPEGPI